MHYSTKAALSGILLAAFTIGYSSYVERAESDLYQKCLQEQRAEWSSFGDAPASLESSCLYVDLQKVREERLTPTKRQLLAAHGERIGTENMTPILFSLAGLLAVPYAWYFLLRRLREVADAIRGNGPGA